MILDEIVLHNFGVFLGRQRAVLTPPSAEKPIVLFAGMNGCGKTTILEALHLGLHGRHSATRKEESGSYDDYLRRLIHRSTKPEDGASIEITFRATTEGRQQQYAVCRSWADRGQRVTEGVDVFVDGRLDRALSDTWAEEVERFMPSRLAPLFFFDGERIASLADPEQSAKLLSTAVHGLLGLDLVEQLKTDLIALERRKQRETVSGPHERELAEAEAQLAEADQRVALARQERAAMLNKREHANKRLRQLDQRFHEGGGTLLERRQELEQQRAENAGKLEAMQCELLEMAEGLLPLAQVQDLLAGILIQDDLEVNAERAESLRDLLNHRDKRLLGELKKHTVDASAVGVVQGFLRAEQKRDAKTKRVQRYLTLSSRARSDLRALMTSRLPVEMQRASRLISAATEHAASLDELDQKLAAVPDRDALATLIREREQSRELLAARDKELAVLDEQLAELERSRASCTGKLQRLLEARTSSALQNQDVERFTTHSRRVRSVLEHFRESLLQQHVSRLEELILESFRQLLRKETLVATIRIDPRTYALELRDASGILIPSERLSAGEQQLLAVSILWALGRASGRPLPAVIDTPLGRLDSSHREHLIDRYFPFASHQVLLLSTDEEIDERQYARIRRWVGHTYRLDYDEASCASTIASGYFW